MILSRTAFRVLLSLVAVISPAIPQSKTVLASGTFPASESLRYSIEWRLIYAGDAHLSLTPQKASDGSDRWNSNLHLETGGLVSKLYKLEDKYQTQLQSGFCTTFTDLEALEGKKRYSTKVKYAPAGGKASYQEKDLTKNAVVHQSEVDVPACASDIIGSLYKLRTIKLEPGQSTQLPMSDGKKTAVVRVEAQEREDIQTKVGTFKTIRYESFVFNGVVYPRKARLFVWLTDDARRLPVQVQARLSFPIGSITLQLDKDENAPVASLAALR